MWGSRTHRVSVRIKLHVDVAATDRPLDTEFSCLSKAVELGSERNRLCIVVNKLQVRNVFLAISYLFCHISLL